MEKEIGDLGSEPLLRGRTGCEELPAGMPELGLLERLVLCFHYLARPWRRSAGRLGSAEFTYLHGSSALSVELKESAYPNPCPLSQ